MKPKRPVSRLGFEIAIFCALTIEKDAVEALFDQHWGDGFGKAPGDSNTYITGSIGRHNVVLFQKSGLGGAAAAALAAKDCQASFPNIKLALVVGLCGAVPFISSTNHEIILGDVIIGKGIVDYSLAGQPAARFVRKNMLPDSLGQFYMGIRELLEKLDSRHGKSTLGKKMINYLAELQKVSNLQAQYPGVDCDKLFEATYPHPTDMETCEKCGNEQVISRTRLQWQEAQAEVHFGLIASGDRILNSGQERDHFAKEENVIGFDMASAGVCDIFPSIVIKGVCGYADNHKTKEWQHYAASTAAACTKALLEFSDAAQFIVPYPANRDFIGRADILQQLKNTLGSTQWKTKTSYSRVSLYGLGGIGKTQIALAYVYWLREVNPAVSVLWVHAGSTDHFRQSYMLIAEEYQIPGYDDPLVDVLFLVKTWLEKKDTEPWLMILDDADDMELCFGSPRGVSLGSFELKKESKLFNYLPENRYGDLIITTRNHQLAIRLARGQNIIQVGNMSVDESEELLRAKLDNISESSADLSLLSSQLGFLPLALSQAAFYIQKAGITPSKYFELLVKHEQNTAQLLSEEVETAVHDLPTSWGFQDTIILSLELLEQQNPLASEILLFISLLDPENIPTEFLLHYTKQKRNQESINDIKLMDALGALEASCLIIGSKNRGYGIHRLIQGILRKWLTDSGKIGQFRKEVLMVVSSLYPQGGYETRTVCAAYLPHAYAILQSGDFTLNDELEAKASLLHCIATYLNFEGKWDNAESLALEAMQIRQELFGEYDISTLTSMANLASISYNHGRWEEAEQLQAIIMEKRKTKLGADHPDTLNSMSNLAIIYGNQGRYEQAEQLERQVTEILNIKLGADHPDTLNSMSDLAIIYRNQGRYEQAEQLEVRVMESLKIKFGADHPNTLASMTTLARIYRKQGRWDAAEQLEVQIMESLKTKLGDNHLLTLRSMANLATIYWKQGQWDEAEKLLVQVMELRENNLGADHPDTLTSMTTLAAIYRDQGRLEKAEQFNIQASEKIKTTLGAEHPDTLAILTNLASIYSDQGRFADAEKLERQVMEISKNKLGADHPSTLKSLANLASTYESQGRWKEAETLNVQAMEGFKTKLGIDHPDTLSSMSNLAAVYRHQDRWEEAKELLLRVTETRELYLGSDHPDTLTGLANLATIYDDQGLWADAELLLIRVSGALRRVLGEKHPRTLGALGNLASTFRQHGRLEEAEELFVQVIQTKKEVLGEMHPETLSSTTELALVLEANDRYLEARDYLQHVLELQQQCLGPQHTNTTNTRSLMERIVQEIERPQRPWTEKSNSTSSEPPGTFWSAADSSSDPTEQSIEDPSADILNNKKFFPMTFFNYKLLEPGLELYQPLDDVESIASIEDDIQSLDGSSSDTALAAVSYITKMFVDNPELFGLYHEATKIFGEAKFIRSHRRLLKKFYLDLVPESRTPQQHVAIDFLRSRVARIRISQSIYRILKPLDRTNREKVNAILEQETDDMFLLERHLVGIGPIEQGIQASIPDGTVPDDEEVADDIDVSSQSSSEASSLDVSGHDDHSFQTLKSIGEFLTLSESFNLYKRNVRNFLYSPPKVQKGDYILRNNMVLSALSRQQPSLEEAKSRNSPAKATGPSHMETNETGKKLYNIPEKKHGRNLKEIPNESVNWGFLKLFQAWLRPSPCPGRQRITWKSARGKLLYIDIEGASKQEACRIQDSFRRTPITDEQSDMPSAPPDANFPIIPPMAYCRPNTHAGNPPTSFTDSDLGTTLGILSNNPEPGTRMARPCYLLLCVTTRHNTYYQSINITRVLHDQSLFQAIRDEYFNLKSKENQDFWPKSGFLLYLVTFLQSCLKIAEFFTPRSVELVSFFLMPVPKGTEQNFWPFGLQLSYPPEDEVKAQRWDYQPCPKRFTNLHMSKAFVTTILEPGHAHHNDAWLHLFPKKLGSSLRYERGGTNLGWGIHIIEGLEYRKVAWVALLLVALSGILGILYSSISGDTGSAFTVAAWVVGAATLAICSVELSIK